MSVDSSVSEMADEKIPLLSQRTSLDAEDDWDCSFGMVSWLGDLEDKLGYQLLVILFSVEHVLNGFVDKMTIKSEFFVFAEYNIDAVTISIFNTVKNTPKLLVPIIGLVSDLMPIGGYNKMPYMIMASILGCFSIFCVGFLPYQILPITFIVVCFFLTQLQCSTCSILVSGTIAQKIREIPEYGPNIMSFIWSGNIVGEIIGTILTGVLITAFSEKVPYMVALIPALLVMIPMWRNYLQEVPQSAEDLKESRAYFYRQKEVCFLCVILLLSVGALAAATLIYADPEINALVSVIVLVIAFVSFTITLSPKIAAVNAWSLLSSAFIVPPDNAVLFYFLTDDAEQYPEGPHLSTFFYTTVLGVVQSVLPLLGIVSYLKFSRQWRFRNLLIIPHVVNSMISLMAIVLYTRLNLKIGIPDTVFVLVTTGLERLSNQWITLPKVLLFEYMCPKNMEATMAALLQGCGMLGTAAAASFGALLFDKLDIHPDGSLGESEQFRNMWKATLIISILPVIVTVLLIKLIPDVAQGDRILELDEDATTGSLLNRWLGR